jgi:hypothetical protein
MKFFIFFLALIAYCQCTFGLLYALGAMAARNNAPAAPAYGPIIINNSYE